MTDSFFGEQFYQKQAQTKMVKGKMTEVAVKVSCCSFSSFSWLQE